MGDLLFPEDYEDYEWFKEMMSGGEMGKPVITKKCNGFYVEEANEIVKILRVDDEKYFHYLREEYDKIFPEYNPETDTVRFADYSDCDVFLVLQRKNIKKTSEVPPAGMYIFNYDRSAVYFKRMTNPSNDQYIELNNCSTVLQEDIDKFFSSKEVYDRLGFRFRRSALIYGPPGTGKTFTILKVIEDQVKKNDVLAFYIDESFDGFRDIYPIKDALPDRKFIFVIEEITERTKRETERLLSFLDGELSWENCYTIATTNYPEVLDSNIVDRPGRFDCLIHFNVPDIEERKAYLSKYMEVDDEFLEMTEGLSFTYLKEIILSSELEGISPKEVLKRQKKRKNLIKRDFKENSIKFGFGE